MSRRRALVQGYSVPKLLGCGVQLVGTLQGLPEIGMAQRRAWSQRDVPPQALDLVLAIIDIAVGHRKVEVHRGKMRIQLQGAPIVLNRLAGIPPHDRNSQRVVPDGPVGPHANRLPERGDRLLGLPSLSQDQTQVAMRFRVVRLYPQGLSKVKDDFAHVPTLLPQH